MNIIRSILITCLLLVSSGSCFETKLSPPKESYKILMLLPVGSRSHRNTFTPLAQGLADRGHKVVILSGFTNKQPHENITEINHGMDTLQSDTKNMFKESEGGVFKMLNRFKDTLPKVAQKLYKIDEVRELYERKDEFDLMIVNGIVNEVSYPFLHGKPFIVMCIAGHLAHINALHGNVLNPAYVPGLFDYPRPYSMFNRLINTMFFILGPVIWKYISIVPLVQAEIDKQFPDLPPLLDIERNLSMSFVNSHFSIDIPIPLMPSEIETGFLHCHPSKPLPEDLKQWIDGAGHHGVIYFSLGSVAKGKTMPDKYKEVFIEAFSKLDQRVIWKYEEELTGVSSNVLISKWLPQQDILGNPNVKMFITHGGLLSTQEAIYHAKPVIALPIFADQPRNAAKLTSQGFGVKIDWQELTVEKLIDTIKEILGNPTYKDKLSSVSKTVRDQPMSPLDSAIWWTEYVARNKKGPERSPAASLSWIEYLMLDVILIGHVILYIIYKIIKKTIKILTKKHNNSNKLKTN